MIITPPKLSNRFRFEAIPSMSTKPIESLSLQAVVVHPIDFSPNRAQYAVDVVFEDDMTNRVLTDLMALWDTVLTLNVSLHDPQDQLLSKWTFADSKLSSFANGPFDYTLSGAVLIEGHFVGRSAKLAFKR